MEFLNRIFGKKDKKTEKKAEESAKQESAEQSEEVETLNLGWYYSENKREWQIEQRMFLTLIFIFALH
jgi:hypothetical protein